MTVNQTVTLIVAVVVLMLLSGSFFTVDQRERVLLFQLGEIRDADFDPGPHFKLPLAQSIKRFDARIQTIDNQTENFLTIEKKNVEVDFYIKWRIADTRTYYRSTGGDELVAADRLSAIVNRGLRNEFGSRTVQQVVSGERDEILDALEAASRDNVLDLGIEIVDVRVKRVDLPRDVSDSVYERMRAERQRVASELRARGAEQAEKIRAEADRSATVLLADAYRQAETLRGTGDAEAAKIYADAYGKDPEFYSFYRSLDVYRNGFSSSSDIMVLDGQSELFKYFRDGAGR